MLTLSLTEYPSYAVFLLPDLDTQRVCRFYDFTAQLSRPEVAHCIAGKVNSSGRLYLVIESVWPDTRHTRSFSVPAPVDGAGGSAIGRSTGLPNFAHNRRSRPGAPG
jgi:hypothetical protein